jgi:hypothetical protein
MLKKYTLMLSFESLEELEAYEKLHTVKKKVDMRGSKTKDLHKLTREIRTKNPKLTYKTCLKMAGKEIRNKKI